MPTAYQKNPLIQISRSVVLKFQMGDHVKVENNGGNGYIFNPRDLMESSYTDVYNQALL